MCDLTPYSRAEYYSAFRHIKECVANPKSIDTLSDNELVTLAWRFFIVNRMGINGRLKGCGWSYTRTRDHRSVKSFRNKITSFIYFHERLKYTHIECDDAVRVIHRFDTPETFFFVDPPYLPEVLKDPQNYDFLMTEADHRRLLETLCHVQGKVLITHPRCPLYESYLKDWVVREVTYYKCSAYSTSLLTQIPQAFNDALWLNYEPKGGLDNAST
jgi:DNA adenine methylase